MKCLIAGFEEVTELTIEQYENIKNKNIQKVVTPGRKLNFNQWSNKIWEHRRRS